MPSTSGDASDISKYKYALLMMVFQCPQHRAMHLTIWDIGTANRVAVFQCPQHRAMHLTLQSMFVTIQEDVSMPSTSGDASDMSMGV